MCALSIKKETVNGQFFIRSSFFKERPLTGKVDLDRVSGAISYYILNDKLPPCQLTMQEMKKVSRDVFEDEK